MTYMWLLARHGIHHAVDITDGMVLEEICGRFFRLRRGTVDTFELPMLPGWRLHEALLPIKGMPRHAWLGCASGTACKALELQRSWGDRRPIRLVHQTVVIGLWIFQERVLRHLPGEKAGVIYEIRAVLGPGFRDMQRCTCTRGAARWRTGKKGTGGSGALSATKSPDTLSLPSAESTTI